MDIYKNKNWDTKGINYLLADKFEWRFLWQSLFVHFVPRNFTYTSFTILDFTEGA